MTYDVMTDELLERVVFALECVLNNDYNDEFDSDGNLTALELRPGWFEEQVDTAFLEGYFKRVLSPAESDALFSLKECRTPQQTQAVFELLMPPERARKAAADLASAEWESILLSLNSHFAGKRNVAEWMGEIMQKERETFSSPFGLQAETVMDGRHPGIWKFFAARKYVTEVKGLLPELVERATTPEFRLLAASKTVPDSVQRYLNEASRCYIYGHFLASLMVCRSAVEEAVKQRLLEMNEEVQDRESLKQLLDRAKGRLLDNTRWGHADQIREKGRKAVHGHEMPTHADCIDALIKTRGILEHLFGRLH